MTLKELKNALLQEAVQGKLVPQIASEGNARDLLEEIRKEKVKLVKEKTVKKEKKIAEITDDEIPFDIPETWSWCRITDIAFCELGKTKDSQKNKGEFKDYLCSINIQENGIDLSKVKQMKFEKDEIDRYSVQKNDLLICEGGDAGRCAIYPFDTPMFYQNALHRVRFYNDVNPFFYLYVLQLYKANKILMEASKGVTIQHLTGESLRNLCFPLPPLSEQKRIVAAIEKFMPLIEEYGKKETELKALNEQIGTLTKKAILQEAVQGKLVPQIAAEGNAKKLLEEIKKEKSKVAGKASSTSFASKTRSKEFPPITDDEIPFDIPENWCWCRLGDISTFNGGYAFKSENYVTKENGVRVLRISDFGENGIKDKNPVYYPYNSELENYKLSINDIIMCMTGGTVGKSFLVKDLNEEMYVNQRVADIKCHKLVDIDYIYSVILSHHVQLSIQDNKNSTNDNISADLIKNFFS